MTLARIKRTSDGKLVTATVELCPNAGVGKHPDVAAEVVRALTAPSERKHTTIPILVRSITVLRNGVNVEILLVEEYADTDVIENARAVLTPIVEEARARVEATWARGEATP